MRVSARARSSSRAGTGTCDTSRVDRACVAGLLVAEQLLVELLARPQPGVDDLEGLAVLGDQLPGHVLDPDRIAHVEHQRLAGRPMAAAWTTSWQASSMVMK